MTEYMPESKSVEIAYVYADVYSTENYDERKEAFYRWLNEERAKVWDLARSEVRSIPSWYNPETNKGGFWNAVMEILDQNPYRKANQ